MYVPGLLMIWNDVVSRSPKENIYEKSLTLSCFALLDCIDKQLVNEQMYVPGLFMSWKDILSPVQSPEKL